MKEFSEVTEALATSTYPVALTLTPPVTSNRVWAIPLIGAFVKWIILIPHFIILYVLNLAVGLCLLVIWAFVLFSGRYPDWGFALVAGYLRWTTRLALYFLGISDEYPSFSMEAPGDIYIERPATSSRFFAIPLIGFLVRIILLIPHAIVVYVLYLVVLVCQLVIWIPVLFTGHYPGWAYTLNTGTVLWYTRVAAYGLGLTDRYPPFSFS
jgi:hypothetical protein